MTPLHTPPAREMTSRHFLKVKGNNHTLNQVLEIINT